MTEPTSRPPGVGAPFAITRNDLGSVAVLTVVGALDMITAPTLSTELHATLDERPGKLVVDLAGLDFLASAGMAALVDGHRTAGEQTTFAVVAGGPATSRPLRITGLTEVFPVFPNLDAAVAELAE